jgi:class 3 adenylate cyclase
MTSVITGAGGTIMQFAGDSVLAVFGAPFPRADHAARSVAVARAMQACQARLNERWRARGVAPFGLGIGLSTGEVAAALLGTDERVEYSIVGSTVNLAQRLQQLAGGGEIVLSEPTLEALPEPVEVVPLGPVALKGIAVPVPVYRLAGVS